MKAFGDSRAAESKKERLHDGLIHGANAIRPKYISGRSDLRVTLCGMYFRERFAHGSVGLRSGTYKSPVVRLFRSALFADSVCIFWLRLRDSTSVKFDCRALASYDDML